MEREKTSMNLVLLLLIMSTGFAVGRRLAELELYILLAKIIPLFHLSTDVKELEVVQRTVLTTEKPVRIKMTPRP